MSTTKVEKTTIEKVAMQKAGVSFGISQPGGPIVIELRLHHDTVSALKGVQVGFELLNGISLEQAKKILDVLNENVIGVLVTSKSDSKT
jgi:hypothetical protein